jgi:NADH-quinone oxidoreductase subunit A
VEAVNLAAYIPILFLLILSTLFAVASIWVSSKIGPRAPTKAKMTPYESGIVPEGGIEKQRFPVKFYLVSMLFIIFDIETAFLYPWAVAYDNLALFGLIEMGVFIAILLGAYVYVWRRGGLEWVD